MWCNSHHLLVLMVVNDSVAEMEDIEKGFSFTLAIKF